MAALKGDPSPSDAKHDDAAASPLVRIMREFEELVLGFETGLLRSLEDAEKTQLPRAGWRREDIRPEACRLAISELSTKYTRKQIRQSLHAAESHGRRVEEQLRAVVGGDEHAHQHQHQHAHAHAELRSIYHGYFRLYSTELFDLLGQPTDVRFGTLRFHHHAEPACMSVELALAASFFVADTRDTLPFHAFKMPPAPSLQNRGILSRKPEDNGAFPAYDSWLLFTFLGNGCLKVEVPIEMCADVYGGPLLGRENEEVLFWGVFVDDEAP